MISDTGEHAATGDAVNTAAFIVDKDASGSTTASTTENKPRTSENGDERIAGGAEEDEKLHGFPLFIVMASLTVMMFLAMLDMSILGTAIPQITSDFHRLQDVGWYVGVYQLTSATVQPITGQFYTYFSTKWTLMSFFFIFEVGSAVCGAAQSSTMLILGRAIAGIGCSGLAGGCLTVIAGAFTPQKRPFYTSIMTGIGQLGILVGPLLGGLFTEHVTWRWCFYINLPLGAVTGGFMMFINIPDHIHKPPVTAARLRALLPRFDLVGFALFTPASIMLLLALQFGAGDYGWRSSAVIGCFCGAGATAIIFVLWEWRVGRDAMIPLELVSRRIIWTSCFYFALIMAGTVCGGNFLPLYFQSVRGLSPTMSAVYLLSGVVSQMAFVIVSGAFMTKSGFYIPWAAAGAALSSIGAGLITTWKPHSSLGEIFGYPVIFAARGVGVLAGNIAVQHNLPPDEMAVGLSFLVFCQNILAAISITIANTIFQESLKSNILTHAPGVSPEAAIAAGGSAEAVRQLAPAGSDLLDGVLLSYSNSITDVFFLLAPATAVAVFVSFGMGWVDLRKSAPGSQTSTGPDPEPSQSEKVIV